MNKRRKRRLRKGKGSVLVEALCCFFIFIPIAFFIADMMVVTNAAQANEEFAEQLARLCSTLQSKDNAKRACQDVIKQYQPASNVSLVNLDDLIFDVGTRKVTVTTSMVVALPIPVPGYQSYAVRALVVQPIVSFPAPQ